MHAVVIRANISDEEPALEHLKSNVVPQVSQAPGLVAAYWMKSEDGTNGLSAIVFETEEAARAGAARIEDPPSDAGVTLAGVEVREVVASA
jgi:heme-degrading monooxygenase HmoA